MPKNSEESQRSSKKKMFSNLIIHQYPHRLLNAVVMHWESLRIYSMYNDDNCFFNLNLICLQPSLFTGKQRAGKILHVWNCEVETIRYCRQTLIRFNHRYFRTVLQFQSCPTIILNSENHASSS